MICPARSCWSVELLRYDPLPIGQTIPHGLTVEYMPWSSRLYEEVPMPVKGELTVSDQPGLGLKFDQAAFERYGA